VLLWALVCAGPPPRCEEVTEMSCATWLVAAVGIYCIFILGWNCLSFGFAFYFAPRYLFACKPETRPYAGRKPPPGLLPAFLTETRYSAVIAALLPFFWILGRSYHANRPLGGRPPLVLVHGYFLDRSCWLFFMPRLARRGITGPMHTFQYNSFVGIEVVTPRLAAFIERVAARYGVDEVDVVAHSWGGNITRWYIQELRGRVRVRRLVQLGTPNRGTWSASYGFGRPAKQLAVGSPVLARLNAEGAGGNVYLGWSPTDQINAPTEFAWLPPYPPPGEPSQNPNNRQLTGIGHLSLCIAPVAVDLAAACLLAAGDAAGPAASPPRPAAATGSKA
jgi:pimeloyl-ACP methyl ester carboxylesterase